MKDFALWFLEEIPAFLMREPVCYFVAFALLVFAIDCVVRLINIKMR